MIVIHVTAFIPLSDLALWQAKQLVCHSLRRRHACMELGQWSRTMRGPAATQASQPFCFVCEGAVKSSNSLGRRNYY